MKTLCIVSCGARKIWDVNPQAGPKTAKEVYVGPFAKKCQAYAKRFYPGSWCILSAKYGFVFPDDLIPEYYNVSFNNKKTNPLCIEELITQAKNKNLKKHESVVVLGGANYFKIVENVFFSMKIQSPLSGCKGIGFMMQRLNRAILNNEQL